jgi:hypothetical protein
MRRFLTLGAGVLLVEAALLGESPPQLKGTYTLGVAFRFY